MITIERLLTSDGKYPDRANSPELTSVLIDNANILLIKVNNLLKEININEIKISSGFRPSQINKTVKGAKLSAHTTCEAVDIEDDKQQSLCKLITKQLLEKYDLYREDSDYTIGKYTNWCHLQTRPTKSGNRIFKP